MEQLENLTGLLKDGYDFKVTFHCHGMRVTILRDYNEVSSGVGRTFGLAASEALENISHGNKVLEMREAEYAADRICLLKKDLRFQEARLKKTGITLEEVRKHKADKQTPDYDTENK